MISAGNTYSFTFQNVGTYYYYDTIHPWMVGIVIVDSGSQPISNPTSSSSITNSITSQASSGGKLQQQVITTKGIFYAEGIKEETISGNAKLISIPLIYKNTQNIQDQMYSFHFELQDTKGNSHTPETESTWPNVQVLPNDIVRGELKFVIGAGVEPTALTYDDVGFNAYLDVTKTLSPIDQKPTSDLNSINQKLTNGELELKTTNEYLSSNNPVTYNVSVEVNNISDKSISVFPQEFYAKDQNGNVYSIDLSSTSFASGEIYPGNTAHGNFKFQITESVPAQIMLIYDSGYGSPTINTGLHSIITDNTNSKQQPVQDSNQTIDELIQKRIASANRLKEMMNNHNNAQIQNSLPENNQSESIRDFSNYGLKNGEWVKYGLGINVIAQNQYVELLMKNILLKGITASLAQNDNLQINSIDDIDWLKMTINDISENHLTKSSELKIKGQPVMASNSDGMQNNGLMLAIPITTKVDDSFPSDPTSTMPSKMIVTRIIDEQIGSNHVQAYELFGQKNTVDSNGTASEVNVTSHYEKQTGMLLDTHLDARYGSPLLGVVDAHFNISAQDLSIPENGISQSSTIITNPTQQDITNVNQAIAAEVNIGTNNTQTKSIDNNVLLQTTQTTSDSFGVKVSANNQTGPKVIAFNLPITTVNVQNLKDLGVMYDGKLIPPAPNMNAILHAKPTDNPSFAIVVTQSGVQVLVLVPHFSTHSITITNMSKVIPAVPEFPFAVIVLMIATFSIVLVPKMKLLV